MAVRWYIFGAAFALHSTASFAEELGKVLDAHELLQAKPCIHVMALEDDFKTAREGTNLQMVSAWHSYAQGAADILYPGEEAAFTKIVSELFSMCLDTPEKPISELAQLLALLQGP
jgi:hypothetical protein